MKEIPAEEVTAFRDAVRDVRPITAPDRVAPFRAPRAPVPTKRIEDERAVIAELATLAVDGDEFEIEDDATFLRPGLPREILRKLRRSHWIIQDTLDLHGLTGDEATARTAAFLADCKRAGKRCVRIVHGKGLRSPGREPVLKRRVRRLLTRRDEVLAFAEPRAPQGGGGAVVVLLQG